MTNDTGTLLGIAVRPASGAPVQEREQVAVSDQTCIEGDYRRSPGGRMVTVLELAAWEAACADIGRTLPWTTRRANLLVDGIALARQTGRKLVIGDVVLEVTGETRPCENMDDAWNGLRTALDPDWRGGVTCRVLQSGSIRVGDSVRLI